MTFHSPEPFKLSFIQQKCLTFWGGGFSTSQDQDGKPHTPTVSSVTAPASSLPLQELAFAIPCNFVA